MILEFPSGPVTADGVPVAEDLKINFAPNRQLRAKFTALPTTAGGQPVPLDIVIFEYGTPKLEKFALSISVDGVEMYTKIPFKLKLSFDFMKRKWKLRGNFNNKPVDETMNSFAEILLVAQKFV